LKRRTDNGLTTYRFEKLAGHDLVHAIFTRLGGASQGPFAALNVGRSVGDDPAAVEANLAQILASLDLAAERVVTAYQVHSNRVAVVRAQDGGQVIPASDALVTDTPGLALLLRFADCQPILLYDPVRHALGLVHAGWRGLAQGIARRAVETMHGAFGSRPGDLIAGLGPAIGPCCYTVGDNVAAAMGYALPDWQKVMEVDPAGQGWRLDLPAGNAQQLIAAGVQARKMEQAGVCTSCRRDEFYSHRADNGQTGRFAVVAYLLDRRGGSDAVGANARGTRPESERDTVDLTALRDGIGSRLQRQREGPRQEGDTLQPPGLPGFDELTDGSTPGTGAESES
jgi:purine-nucleoside/S-methyl-5'-thioadenosine phosphorylase / adenosine deaminase